MPNSFSPAIPQLSVRSVTETQQYYRDILGFTVDWIWGENDYGAVSRDQTTLYLSRAEGPLHPTVLLINVREVDLLCEDWKSRGAEILCEPEDKPWGLREFTLRDLNGHQFRFAKSSSPNPAASRESATDMLYVHRLPTLEEYTHLIHAVGWQSFTNFEAAQKSLPQSLFCVVAENAGIFVGMARICGDGAQFFYVMDVAVLPDFQRRGIGTALMNEVVRFFQNHGPDKAIITLFTGENRSSFYKRFGFKGAENWLYGMGSKHLHEVEA